MNKIVSRFILLAGALALAGCISDQKLVNPPTPPTTDLLARYVAMGNSITAGMQSAGINDSLQKRAYPVLLAQMAGDGTYFTYPALAMPGCPPPFAGPLGLTGRVGGASAPPCSYRLPSMSLPNNVAVPGEYMADITNTTTPGAGANNALSTFILGGRTEAQMMAAEEPTFVSFWAPNNDILNAVNLGDTTAAVLTPLATYTAGLNAAVAAIKAANPRGAVLIGVVDVPDFAPIVQPGAFFFAAFTANPNQFGKPVDPSCSPFDQLGRPNPFGFNLVSLQVASDPTVTTIRCTPNSKWVTTTTTAGAAGGTPELPVFEKRIADINAAIQAAATANGWIFVNPNTDLGATLGDASKYRKCQGLATATDLASFQAAVLNTCPGPTAPNYFGSWVSFDGTHPSTAFHQALATLLAQRINAKYGTSISTTPPSVGVFAR